MEAYRGAILVEISSTPHLISVGFQAAASANNRLCSKHAGFELSLEFLPPTQARADLNFGDLLLRSRVYG